jgi:hypothetical protein
MGQLLINSKLTLLYVNLKLRRMSNILLVGGVFFEYINYTVIATVAVSRYNHIRKEHVVCNTKTEVTGDE